MSIICKLPNGNYLLWSTITDSPLTYGCPLPDLEAYLKEEYGNSYMTGEHPQRMRRVEQCGTSYMVAPCDFKELSNFNCAGPNGAQLTFDEIIKEFGQAPTEQKGIANDPE